MSLFARTLLSVCCLVLALFSSFGCSRSSPQPPPQPAPGSPKADAAKQPAPQQPTLPKPAASQPTAPQPTPQAKKYEKVPQAAKDILTSLKKLKIKIEIGIDYQTYKSGVDSVYPDMRLFLESAEAKGFPELCFLFTNISDCYLKVREAWNAELSRDIGKFQLVKVMIVGRPLMWTTAAVNTDLAVVLLEKGPGAVASVQQTIKEKGEILTAKFAYDKAEAETRRLEAELAKKESEREPAMSGAMPTIAAREEAKERRLETPGEPHRKLRTWTNATGDRTFEAEFVSVVINRVTLRKADGTRVTLLLSRLSKQDQEWIRQEERTRRLLGP